MHEKCFSLRTLQQERLHIQHLYQTVCLCVGILYAVMSVWLEESVYPFVFLVFLCYAVLLGLFMQELLREIILLPNYTVIMEMRGSCLETQKQNDDETVCVRVCVAVGHADGVR